MSIEFHDMVLDDAMSWFGPVGTILRVGLACYRCYERWQERIGNQQHNNLHCRNCESLVNQYTNCCKFTVNPVTGQVGHAAFVPAGRKWYWFEEGGFFEKKRSKLSVPYYIKASGLRGRSMVLDTKIEDYQTGRLLTSHSSVLESTYDTATWQNHYHYFPDGNFRDRTSKILLVVSALRSEYRDTIFQDNRIIEPWKS